MKVLENDGAWTMPAMTRSYPCIEALRTAHDDYTLAVENNPHQRMITDMGFRIHHHIKIVRDHIIRGMSRMDSDKNDYMPKAFF